MGSFSSKKKDDKKADKNTALAVAAAQPKAYEDPFGRFDPGNPSKFTPIESEDQVATRGIIDTSIRNIAEQVPTEFDIDSYYNNPFYETTKRMYQRVIDQQRERESKELDDNLNARNQMGSSYDALRRRYFDQDYASRYDQSDDQARMASASAYQQAYQNLLESMRGLSNERSAQLDRIYAPAKIAMGYQSAIAPLQNAQAGAYAGLAGNYASRPAQNTVMGDIFDYYKSSMNAAGAIAGGYYGA